MNTEVIPEANSSIYTLGELTGKNFSNERSAFLGNVGGGEYGLYMVTWGSIFRVSYPDRDYWISQLTCVVVDKFVNITITVDKG